MARADGKEGLLLGGVGVVARQKLVDAAAPLHERLQRLHPLVALTRRRVDRRHLAAARLLKEAEGDATDGEALPRVLLEGQRRLGGRDEHIRPEVQRAVLVLAARTVEPRQRRRGEDVELRPVGSLGDATAIGRVDHCWCVHVLVALRERASVGIAHAEQRHRPICASKVVGEEACDGVALVLAAAARAPEHELDGPRLPGRRHGDRLAAGRCQHELAARVERRLQQHHLCVVADRQHSGALVRGRLAHDHPLTVVLDAARGESGLLELDCTARLDWEAVQGHDASLEAGLPCADAA